MATLLLNLRNSVKPTIMTSVSGVPRVLLSAIRGVLKASRKSCSTHFVAKEFEEIKFSVPWGHISAKWYGPRNTRPIVGLHGWQDNAGTFDTLAPLLPSHVGFLAIDLPGHGLSSWLPDGCTYHSLDYVTFLLTLMQEFNWSKISMICHSMSSINGFIFCSLFPDKCDMFVGLDILKPIVRSEDKIIEFLGKRLEAFNRVDKMNRSKTEPPSYEYDQLVERLHEGTEKSINKENCQYILKRNTKPSIHTPHKFYFSRDSRLKTSIFYALPQAAIMEMGHRIVCPHLFIKALQSPYYENKKYYDELINFLTTKSTFEYHQVDGTHHVHLNEPRKIANIINPFINEHRPQ